MANKPILSNVKINFDIGDVNNRLRLKTRYLELKSWEALSKELDVNICYVYRYVMYGEWPANREVQEALGIKDRALEYTRERNARLKDIYNSKGWVSPSEFNTALLNDEAELPRKDRKCLKN